MATQPRIEVTDETIRFVYDGDSLVLVRVIAKGDVTITARRYSRMTDSTAVYEDISGRAAWAMLHDFLA